MWIIAGRDPHRLHKPLYLFVIPAKAGNHGATCASGWMGSRFRGNDEIWDA
jgi:hypothetical protein